MEKLLGGRSGTTKTWLDASGPPHESASEALGERVAGGQWVRIATFGSVNGQVHAGEMTVGWNGSAYEMSWVDSFHTAGTIILSQGAPREDGAIAVTGSYAAGRETWRWRTEFHETLTRAYNISPQGEESLAVETLWR